MIKPQVTIHSLEQLLGVASSVTAEEWDKIRNGDSEAEYFLTADAVAEIDAWMRAQANAS